MDLGLPSRTLWCSHNVGAATETEYGDYFMWGSITPNTDTPCDWANAPFNNGQSSYDETYFNAHKSEWLDANGNLKPEYDAAHTIMGGDWRMPTEADFNELLEGTNKEWVNDYQGSGNYGRLFTSKTNGNTMFIPASGTRRNSSFSRRGDNGSVWSSVFSTNSSQYARHLNFSSTKCSIGDITRSSGMPIRGVMKP